VFFTAPSAFSETWKIITLDWPPYSLESSPDKGIGCQALKEVLKSVGVDIEFVFMPWSRGIYEVQKPEYAGLFPVWKNEGFRGGKNSPVLFKSPIVFAFNKEKIRPWKKLEDLKGLNIGIVENYGYPKEILDLGKQGVYKLQTVPTDEQNLRMLSFQRIDMTVVDLINARYMSEIKHPELQAKLFYDPQVYENADLFLAMKDDKNFKSYNEKIKAALKKYPMQKRIDELLKKIFSGPSQSETLRAPSNH
jgi:polar amino acid transport system substrate-binding protein